MKSPIINTYTSYGTIFSLMNEKLLPWVYDNFIQVVYARGWGMFAFESHHLLMKNCPGLSFYNLPREIVVRKWGSSSIKDLLMEAIQMGYYLYIFVDRYFIPGTESFKEKHISHEMLIYGFDEETNEVYIADNMADGRFIKTKCSFQDLDDAYWAVDEEYNFLTEIRFLKPADVFYYKFSIEKICASLNNYLLSKETYELAREQDFDFGIQAIHKINQEIEEASIHNDTLSIRSFHFFYEHKMLMEMRIRYLIENKYLDEYDSLLEQAEILKKEYLIIRNLVLKYNMKRDVSILKGIQNKIEESLNIEKSLILNLLSKLEGNKRTSLS